MLGIARSARAARLARIARVSLGVAIVLLPAAAWVGCFPDFQVAGFAGAVDGSVGADGAGSADGAQAGDGAQSGDGSQGGDGGSNRDGGASSDGAATFDASASKVIPAGTYVFKDPSNSTSTTATITHDFYMDGHETTTDVFRAWVAAARPVPCTSGACTLDPGGPYQASMQWDSSWTPQVALEKYKDNPSCSPAGSSFASGLASYNGTDDAVPINCLNWYQAVALCWFDGQKRLATQVEWLYEASGRGRGRTYPWGDTPTPTDCSHAIWTGDGGNDRNGCNFPIRVGSAPAGASFDGVDDMAGSVAEWTWDWYDNTYPSAWPPDYAGPSADAGSIFSRMTRGGNWDAPEIELHTNRLGTHDPVNAFSDVGVRCVKTKL
jgi:formylglycine-generating enzyme required for sulfatase activity